MKDRLSESPVFTLDAHRSRSINSERPNAHALSGFTAKLGRNALELHHFEDALRFDVAYLAEACRRLGRRAAIGSFATILSFSGANVATAMTEVELPASLYSVGNADCSTSNFTVLHASGTGKHTSQHMEYLNRKFIEQNGGASWDLWYGTKWDSDEIHKMIDDKAKACNRRDKIPLYINTMSLGGKLMQQVINKGNFEYAEMRGLIMSAGAPSAEEVKKPEARIGVELAASFDRPLPVIGWPFIMTSAAMTEITRNGVWYTLTNPAAYKSISDSVNETNAKITAWQMRENGLPVGVENIPQAGTAREMEYYFVGSEHDKVVNNSQALEKWRQLTGAKVYDFWIEQEKDVVDSDNHADDWVASRRDPTRQIPRYDTNKELNYNEVYALIYRKAAVKLAGERQKKDIVYRSGAMRAK